MIPMGDDECPDLPYAGTSGHSGSDTSRERAERADADGTTSERQALVLHLLSGAWTANPDATRTHRINPMDGVTWKELSTVTGHHHGVCSGVLSVLHKTGRLARLAERRGRCAIYVLPEHVNGRLTMPQGRQAPPVDPAAYVLARTRPTKDGCLLWTGAVNEKGYGHLSVAGRTEYAHQVVAKAAGLITDDQPVVRHTCDQPTCVNPAHLLGGTHADNTADMLARDRHPAHMRPRTILTEESL